LSGLTLLVLVSIGLLALFTFPANIVKQEQASIPTPPRSRKTSHRRTISIPKSMDYQTRTWFRLKLKLRRQLVPNQNSSGCAIRKCWKRNTLNSWIGQIMIGDCLPAFWIEKGASGLGRGRLHVIARPETGKLELQEPQASSKPISIFGSRFAALRKPRVLIEFTQQAQFCIKSFVNERKTDNPEPTTDNCSLTSPLRHTLLLKHRSKPLPFNSSSRS